MKRLFLGALMVALVTAMIGCSAEPAPPTFEALPTPTTPPDFVAFVDESSLFSIAHPPSWELAMSNLPEMEQFIIELVQSKDSDLPLDNAGIVFNAGFPAEELLDPSVSIVVESLSEEMSIEEFAQASENGLAEFVTGLQIHSRSAAVVGGRESMILDFEYDISTFAPGATGTLRDVELFLVDGKIGWSVRCGGTTPQIEDYLEICDAIVRSFRILE